MERVNDRLARVEPADEAPNGTRGPGFLVARHYSSEAEAYRDLWAPVLVRLSGWLIDELPLLEARRVLDLGCGAGTLLPRLSEASPEAMVVGLDRTEAMVALGPRQFPLLVGDAVHLPFADGSFDAVVMAFMLFHLPQPSAALAEARRVLRPGGWIGLLTWGKERDSQASTLWVEELDAEGAAEFSPKLAWHELVDTPRKVTGELKAVGFTEVISWVELCIDRPNCQEFLARRTSLGRYRYRWESLEERGRQALLDRALRRLQGMSQEGFETESEVIVTVGQRPGLSRPR